MQAQGWYHDPYQIHEARWFSAGAATSLVRDGDQEASDDPPSNEWQGELSPVRDDETFVPDEITRAGESSRSSDPFDHLPPTVSFY